MQRRHLLIAGTTLTAGLIAGCTGSEADGGDGNAEDTGDDGGDGNGNGNGNGNENENESENGADAEELLESEDSESAIEGLEITEHEFYEEDYSAGVKGVVANNTGDTLDYVEVGVVFYNAEDQRIDDMFTNTTDLADGEEWVFDVMFLGDDSADVDRYTIAVTDSPF